LQLGFKPVPLYTFPKLPRRGSVIRKCTVVAVAATFDRGHMEKLMRSVMQFLESSTCPPPLSHMGTRAGEVLKVTGTYTSG